MALAGIAGTPALKAATPIVTHTAPKVISPSLVRVPDIAKTPMVASSGAVSLVLYEDASGALVGHRYDAGGEPLGEAFDIQPSRVEVDFVGAHPRAVVFDGQSFVVVWLEETRKEAANLYLRRISVNGALVGDPVLLFQPAYNSRVAMAAGANEALLVSCTSDYEPVSANTRDTCSTWRISDSGVTSGEELLYEPGPTPLGSEVEVALARSGDGWLLSLIVSYKKVVTTRLDEAAHFLDNPPVEIATPAKNAWSITALGVDDGVLLAWSETDQTRLAKVALNGQVNLAPLLEPERSPARSSARPILAMTASGPVLIGIIDPLDCPDCDAQLAIQRVSPSSSIDGSPFRMATEVSFLSSAVATKTSSGLLFVITDRDQRGVVESVTTEPDFVEEAPSNLALRYVSQSELQLAAGPGGWFGVWREEGFVRGARLNEDGVLRDTPWDIASPILPAQPRAVSGGENGWLIAVEQAASPDGGSILVSYVNAAGVANPPEVYGDASYTDIRLIHSDAGWLMAWRAKNYDPQVTIFDTDGKGLNTWTLAHASYGLGIDAEASADQYRVSWANQAAPMLTQRLSLTGELLSVAPEQTTNIGADPSFSSVELGGTFSYIFQNTVISPTVERIAQFYETVGGPSAIVQDLGGVGVSPLRKVRGLGVVALIGLSSSDGVDDPFLDNVVRIAIAAPDSPLVEVDELAGTRSLDLSQPIGNRLALASVQRTRENGAEHPQVTVSFVDVFPTGRPSGGGGEGGEGGEGGRDSAGTGATSSPGGAGAQGGGATTVGGTPAGSGATADGGDATQPSDGGARSGSAGFQSGSNASADDGGEGMAPPDGGGSSGHHDSGCSMHGYPTDSPSGQALGALALLLLARKRRQASGAQRVSLSADPR